MWDIPTNFVWVLILLRVPKLWALFQLEPAQNVGYPNKLCVGTDTVEGSKALGLIPIRASSKCGTSQQTVCGYWYGSELQSSGVDFN